MTGSTCPSCEQPIGDSAAIEVCDGCGSVYHAVCWDEDGGCTVNSCHSNLDVASPMGPAPPDDAETAPAAAPQPYSYTTALAESNARMPSGYAPPLAQEDNNSGMGEERVPIGVDVDRFNWGAFILGVPFWLCSNGMVAVGLITFVGLIVLGIICLQAPWVAFLIAWGINFYLGTAGSRLAWRYRHFRDVNQFVDVQRIWAGWGIAFAIFDLFYYMIYFGSDPRRFTGPMPLPTSTSAPYSYSPNFDAPAGTRFALAGEMFIGK